MVPPAVNIPALAVDGQPLGLARLTATLARRPLSRAHQPPSHPAVVTDRR